MIILAVHSGIDIPPSIYIRKWLRMMELLRTMPFLGKWFWGIKKIYSRRFWYPPKVRLGVLGSDPFNFFLN